MEFTAAMNGILNIFMVELPGKPTSAGVSAVRKRHVNRASAEGLHCR